MKFAAVYAFCESDGLATATACEIGGGRGGLTGPLPAIGGLGIGYLVGGAGGTLDLAGYSLTAEKLSSPAARAISS